MTFFTVHPLKLIAIFKHRHFTRKERKCQGKSDVQGEGGFLDVD